MELLDPAGHLDGGAVVRACCFVGGGRRLGECGGLGGLFFGHDGVVEETVVWDMVSICVMDGILCLIV